MQTNLLLINTEIETAAHKMWAEGTCDNQPTEQEVIDFMDGQMWQVGNVSIFHDDMQGFWRWNCDLVKPLFTNDEYLDLHGAPDGVYPPPVSKETLSTETPIGGETVEQAATEMFQRGSYRNYKDMEMVYIIGAKFGAQWQSQQTPPHNEDKSIDGLEVDYMKFVMGHRGELTPMDIFKAGYNTKHQPIADGDLKERFEAILKEWGFDENYPTGIGYVTDAMEAAYNLKPKEQVSAVALIEAEIIHQMHDDSIYTANVLQSLLKSIKGE